MNNLCTDIGWMSLNKKGEQLCGDHVDIVPQGENSTVVVLADGMGSGVKANILSTLTAKIISTMMAEGLHVEDCVETIASTLPICAVRGVAYSTFTIIRIIENEEAEIIQYDNPFVVLLRNGKNWEYPREAVEIGGKTIYKTRIPIQKDDTFIAFSDGAIHAGIGMSLNFGWERKDIIDYMEMMYDESFTAKTLNALLLDECNKLYGGQPGDDTTAVCVKVRERCCVNLMIGPPSKPEDLAKMHEAFFSAPGKRIVCGGTTSTLAAEYLKKPIIAQLDYLDSDIPPTAKVEGLDLVTEGVITMSKVVEYAKDYLEENRKYSQWGYKRDGASMIARMLFEEATDINFFVGRAVNPAHQNPNLPINFNIKMQLVENLCTSLEKMGKKLRYPTSKRRIASVYRVSRHSKEDLKNIEKEISVQSKKGLM